MPTKILINGIEYAMSKESESTVLVRTDPESGMVVKNVFTPRVDSEARMSAFMEKVADLVLRRTTA